MHKSIFNNNVCGNRFLKQKEELGIKFQRKKFKVEFNEKKKFD